jgi:predicted PurR-regulated permease PerM
MTAQQTFRNTLVVILTLVGAYAVFMSMRILIVVLIAIILASALRPFILWLQKRGVSPGLAILIVYGSMALIVFTLAVLVLPPAVNQLSGYLQNDERLANRLINAQNWVERNVESITGRDIEFVPPETIREQVAATVEGLVNEVPNMAGSVGAVLGEVVLTLVVGIYWLTARDEAVQWGTSLFSLGRRALMAEIITEIESSLGTYVRGVLTVSFVVGIANFIILSLFSVPNAVTLAFIIGITTALPVIGGFIGAGAAVLLALLSSPVNALITLASFVAVQQVEVHWLTPRTMARSVGLNPILVITILFVGFSLGGVVGGLIAVPVAGTFSILLKHLVIEPRKEENAPQLIQGGILIASKTAPDAATGVSSTE